MAIATWMLSAALAVWLPGMRAGLPRLVLGAGWASAFAALGCAFAAGQAVSVWTSNATRVAEGLPRSATGSAAPWLLLTALALTAASLLIAL